MFADVFSYITRTHISGVGGEYCFCLATHSDALSIRRRGIQIVMVADLCHVVLSCFRGEKAKMRNTKTRQMVICSCFCMTTFRPATRKYDSFHASPFRLLFVVSLPGEAKGRYAKNTKRSPFGGFSRGDLSCFRSCLSYLCMAGRKVATRKSGDFVGFLLGNRSLRHV